MIKCIIFDLDGILVDTKPLHFNALNAALSEFNLEITYDEHLRIYDGLPTKKKLELLTKHKGLDISSYDTVWKLKQEYTKKMLYSNITYDNKLIDLFSVLKDNGYRLFVATNSIQETTKIMLDNIGVMKFLDGYLTNENVKHPKPHPEIYLRTIIESGFAPHECLILEDSIYGVQSAQNSCANVMIINHLNEVNLDNIMNKIKEIDNNKEKKKFPFKGNIVIPMAGRSSRFEAKGYALPKFLLDTINNKTMVQLVVDSLGLDGHYIYLVRKEHLEKFNLRNMLNILTPGCDIVEVDGITEGSVCTILLAKDLINNDKELVIANCDQYIEYSPEELFYLANNQSIDAMILTFNATSPKWSFCKVDNDNFVTEVAEKSVISDIACTGIYYSKLGSEFVRYAEQMINKNIRINNEFYTTLVYAEYLKDKKRIKNYKVDFMAGTGTPEDWENFIRSRSNK